MRPLAPLVIATLLIAGVAGCLQGKKEAFEAAPIPKKLTGIAGGAPVPVCDYKFDADYSQICATGPYLELPFETELLTSAVDGVDIEVGWWLPDVPEGTKVPTIVMASPYYGNLGEPMGRKSGYLLMLTQNFVQHGYAVAGISARGTGDSGGCMDLMGEREVRDLDQAITWLGEQPWSNGNIGMIGLSYDGSTPWSVASTGNKYVKTIVPISGVPDVYQLMFKNGSAESRGPFLLNLLYYAFAVRVWLPDLEDPSAEVPATAIQRIPEGAICPESWVGLGAAAYSGVTGARDPQGWWAERDRKPGVAANYKGSIFSIQGLQDWNVDPSMVIPWVDELNKTGIPTYQFLGQWGHSYPDTNVAQSGGEIEDDMQRWDWAEILLNWFDYWLKDQKTVALGPPVQVQDNLFNWRFEEHFPPRDATWAKFTLASGNRLTDADAGAESSVMLSPAGVLGEPPQQLRQAPGFLADFATQPFETETRVSGLPRLHVTVTPHGPTGHLAAWMYTVAPDGEMTNVGQTQMNLWFADGTEAMRPVTPNQRLVAKMEFQPLDVVVPAEHRIVVRVWENSDQDRLPAIPPQPVTLHYGGSVASTFELPIIERSEDVFFTPPFPPEE